VAGLTQMRIGVFGGTFDPPHMGHLILAMEACGQLRLDKLLWVVTPDPPHKIGQSISPVEVRIKLIKAAIGDDPQFEVSKVDLERPAPQYAVDTIQELQERYPKAELIYLMGGDSLHDLPEWHHSKRLVEISNGIGVMRRPGDLINLPLLESQLPSIAKKLVFVDAPLLQISSRQIRDRVATGRPFRYYLPQAVNEQILFMGLYTEKEEGAEDRLK
jgi:nicotinate-nucleotide adenylyltransferase